MTFAVEIGSGAVGIFVLVAGLAVGALVVAAMAVTARRLLGVRVGALRTTAAGGVGYVVALLVATTIIKPVGPGKSVLAPELAFIAVLLGVTVPVAMGFLALAEAIVPSGSRPRPVRALRRRLARALRYSQITGIAVRYGLGPFLRGRRRAGTGATQGHEALGRSLRLVLAEGGVTFVKLGQLLSTRRDLLPLELVAELADLQAQAAPVPWPAVEQVLVEELGASPHSVFPSSILNRSPPPRWRRCTQPVCTRVRPW